MTSVGHLYYIRQFLYTFPFGLQNPVSLFLAPIFNAATAQRDEPIQMVAPLVACSLPNYPHFSVVSTYLTEWAKVCVCV